MYLTQEFCDVVHAMRNLKEELATTTNTMVSSILLRGRLLHCSVHRVHSNEVSSLEKETYFINTRGMKETCATPTHLIQRISCVEA